MIYQDTAYLEVDGVELGRNSAFTYDVRDVRASACYLGRGRNGGFFDGRMDNFSTWSRSLIENDPPVPNPAGFSAEPVSVTETKVVMISQRGYDESGIVEYYFDEISGGAGADDSDWQRSLNIGMMILILEYLNTFTSYVCETGQATRLNRRLSLC